MLKHPSWTSKLVHLCNGATGASVVVVIGAAVVVGVVSGGGATVVVVPATNVGK